MLLKYLNAFTNKGYCTSASKYKYETGNVYSKISCKISCITTVKSQNDCTDVVIYSLPANITSIEDTRFNGKRFWYYDDGQVVWSQI